MWVSNTLYDSIYHFYLALNPIMTIKKSIFKKKKDNKEDWGDNCQKQIKQEKQRKEMETAITR